MRNIFMILICISIFSCSVLKDKKEKTTDSKTNTTSTEFGTETIKKEGSTITYEVPNIKYKDTTIIVRNTQAYGSGTLKIAYDKSGNQKIDCIEQDLEIIRNYIKESEEAKIESIKEKEKTKETTIKPIMILWVFVGIALLIILLRVLKKFGI